MAVPVLRMDVGPWAADLDRDAGRQRALLPAAIRAVRRSDPHDRQRPFCLGGPQKRPRGDAGPVVRRRRDMPTFLPGRGRSRIRVPAARNRPGGEQDSLCGEPENGCAGCGRSRQYRRALRPQVERRLADPAGQRRTVQIEARARVDLRLTMQRTMIGILRDQDMDDGALGRQAALDQPSRRQRLDDALLAGPAGIFPANRDDQVPQPAPVCVPSARMHPNQNFQQL